MLLHCPIIRDGTGGKPDAAEVLPHKDLHEFGPGEVPAESMEFLIRHMA